MPRYHFHLLDDVDAPDEDGREFPDLDAAIAYAADNIRFTMAETVKAEGRVVLRHRIDIEDSEGTVLASVPFGDVVKIEE